MIERMPATFAGALCLLFLAEPSASQDTCPLTGDTDSCVRFLACWGEEGVWIHGRAYGFGEGTLAGIRSDDIGCAGTWTAENAFGFGQADVVCEDEVTASVIYTVEEQDTATVVGHGRTSDGRKVTAWSGTHVLRYLRQSGIPDGTLLCGDASIPMS